MPSAREGVITRLIARVRALLQEDWFGKAGERLSETTKAVSEFAEEHRIRPEDLLEEGLQLGRRKVEGLANTEYAAAAKDFAEAEQKKIESELQRRSLDSNVRKAEAEARAVELKNLDAEIELFKKMKEIGVVFNRDEKGNLTVLPTPPNCDLLELVVASAGKLRFTARHSNGLDQFFSYIKDESGLSILDLADVNPANMSYVTNLGHEVYSEDFLGGLILADYDPDVHSGANDFLGQNLWHREPFFDGVLIWDVLEYLSAPLLTGTVERLARIVKPGGYLWFLCHSEEVVSVPQYSFGIKDSKTLLIADGPLHKPKQVFNNRSLEKLFRDFESMKFFLSRDGLREVIVRR